MKAEEMIIKYVVSNGTTTERLNDSDVIILMNDFANQRIIEELERFNEYEDEHKDCLGKWFLERRIEELKQ